MELREFLAAVLPHGLNVVARKVDKVNAEGDPFSTFKHTCVETHTALATVARDISKAGADAYFALATYQQGFHDNPRHLGKKVLRVRENIAELKALWLDIDFKGEYPNAQAVVLALRAFSQATGMPAPAILVGSGNGVHAYWPLSCPEPLERWQKLAEALKEATKQVGLKTDFACTADACRVLRPPGTQNFKDPANPKAVRILYSNGKEFDYGTLETLLLPYAAVSRPSPRAVTTVAPTDLNFELTGGLVTREFALSRFDEIAKHCGVARQAVDTHGASAMEPEWVAMLQLLKHCEDGALWVHPVSDKHPGYKAEATDRKCEQRMHNTAGPTLCNTFEGFQPSICAKCPHNGFIKTPLQLGTGEAAKIEGLPAGWRVAEGKKGVERLMIIDDGEGKTHSEWQRVMRYIPMNLRATRSVVTKKYELEFDVEFQKAKPWSVTLPSGSLGNSRKLTETMAEVGLVLKEREARSFIDLMSTWLEKLQAARRIADVTEQLGWLQEDEKIAGFSCGPTTFYTDGRMRNDVRASREFAAISKFYEPRGGLEPWKKVAQFIAEQNNPAFVAILAAAFGAPLLKFTGHSGGILSIVSTASGVGKSSALKCSQAVWGSPTHGVNAVDDTPKSVARKIGFLNNLPAYWDELRGRKTIEDFLTLAFQITQGKEKSRLDSSAHLRETQTWETMLVVASNESIFEAMARNSGGSDAGVVRTFEIFVDPFASERNRAELALLFEQLNGNYGHAGRIYAQYLATHAEQVQAKVQGMFTRMAQAGAMEAQERFWFAIMAALAVGATIAKDLQLVNFDVKALVSYMMGNIVKLRGRSVTALNVTEPSEIVAAFMQTYQDRALIVDTFPAPKANTRGYIPEIIGGAPRGDKIAYHMSRDQKLLRFPVMEFNRWIEYRQLPVYQITRRLLDSLNMREVRCKLGIGTKWELPPQRCYEVQLDQMDAQILARATVGDSSRPADSPDSHVPSEPEG